MRRFVLPLAMLAGVAIVAGCGGTSGPVNPSTNAALSGQYVFYEQVYAYNASASAAVTAKHSVARELSQAKGLHIGKPFSSMLPRNVHPAISAKPQSGSSGSAITPGEVVGTLTFDGNGNVTAGELDFNSPLNGGALETSVTGTYTVDAGGETTIDLGSSTANLSIEYDVALNGGVVSSVSSGGPLLEALVDNVGDFEYGTGQLVKQSATNISSTGSYVIGWQGQTCYGCTQNSYGDITTAGQLNISGSNVTGTADIATGFATDNNVTISGTLAAADSYGRAVATLTTTGYTNGSLPQSYAVYAISNTQGFALGIDQASTSTEAAPYVSGMVVTQGSSPSLSGNYFLYEVKEDLANEQSGNADTYADASIALLTAGSGTLSGTGDANNAGTVTSGIAESYGYTVASNGRVTLTGNEPGGAAAPVCWLASSSLGYCTEQPTSSELTEPGLLTLQQQSGSSFSNATLSGTYAVGTLPLGTSLGAIIIGVTTSNGSGALADGDGSGSLFLAYVSSSGLQYGNAEATGSYTFASSGRGTLTPGSSSSGFNTGVLYAVSSTQTLALDVNTNDPSPTIQTFQQ